MDDDDEMMKIMMAGERIVPLHKGLMPQSPSGCSFPICRVGRSVDGRSEVKDPHDRRELVGRGHPRLFLRATWWPFVFCRRLSRRRCSLDGGSGSAPDPCSHRGGRFTAFLLTRGSFSRDVNPQPAKGQADWSRPRIAKKAAAAAAPSTTCERQVGKVRVVKMNEAPDLGSLVFSLHLSNTFCTTASAGYRQHLAEPSKMLAARAQSIFPWHGKSNLAWCRRGETGPIVQCILLLSSLTSLHSLVVATSRKGTSGREAVLKREWTLLLFVVNRQSLVSEITAWDTNNILYIAGTHPSLHLSHNRDGRWGPLPYRRHNPPLTVYKSILVCVPWYV